MDIVEGGGGEETDPRYLVRLRVVDDQITDLCGSTILTEETFNIDDKQFYNDTRMPLVKDSPIFPDTKALHFDPKQGASSVYQRWFGITPNPYFTLAEDANKYIIGNADFTISVWMYITKVYGDWGVRPYILSFDPNIGSDDVPYSTGAVANLNPYNQTIGIRMQSSQDFILYMHKSNSTSSSQSSVQSFQMNFSADSYLDEDSEKPYPYPLHIAVVKKDDIVRVFLNGVQKNEMTVDNDIIDIRSPLITIGGQRRFSRPNFSYPNYAIYYSNAYMDDLCVIKNKALWWEDFTPPTSYLPDNLDTI